MRFVVLWLLIWMLPSMLWAVEFRADLDNRIGVVGQATQLHVMLEGASAPQGFRLRDMEPSIEVSGPRRSTNVQMMNGVMRQQHIWTYTLIPTKSGQFSIPAQHIVTDRGMFHSKRLHFNVQSSGSAVPGGGSPGHAVPGGSGASDDRAAPLSAELRLPEMTPYIGQPVVFDIVVKAGIGLQNLSLPKPESDGARIEAVGEPIEREVPRGPRSYVETVVRYVLTPLREGEIVIQPVTLRGEMLSRGSTNLLGRVDPFSSPGQIMRQMMRDLTPQAVAVQTKAHPLRVRSIPAGWQADPTLWLPLHKLELTQEVDAGEQAIGQPVTRRVTMVATGGYREMLPDLEALQKRAIDADRLQFYAGREDGDSVFNRQHNAQVSWQRRDYTYVPLDGGTIVLPEVRIPWWDVKSEEMRWAVLPQEEVPIAGPQRMATELSSQISESVEVQSSVDNRNEEQNAEARDEPETAGKERQPSWIQSVHMVYWVLAVVALAAGGAAFLWWRHYRGVGLTENGGRDSLERRLQNATDHQALYDALLEVNKAVSGSDGRVSDALKRLERSLYGAGDRLSAHEMQEMKALCLARLRHERPGMSKNRRQSTMARGLPPMNPVH